MLARTDFLRVVCVGRRRFGSWLRMHADGTTTVVVNQSEMGQGITTALPMCVAEELDIPFSTVRFEMAAAEERYYNPFWHGITTGGSKEHADDVARDAQGGRDRARDARDGCGAALEHRSGRV